MEGSFGCVLEVGEASGALHLLMNFRCGVARRSMLERARHWPAIGVSPAALAAARVAQPMESRTLLDAAPCLGVVSDDQTLFNETEPRLRRRVCALLLHLGERVRGSLRRTTHSRAIGSRSSTNSFVSRCLLLSSPEFGNLLRKGARVRRRAAWISSSRPQMDSPTAISADCTRPTRTTRDGTQRVVDVAAIDVVALDLQISHRVEAASRRCARVSSGGDHEANRAEPGDRPIGRTRSSRTYAQPRATTHPQSPPLTVGPPEWNQACGNPRASNAGENPKPLASFRRSVNMPWPPSRGSPTPLTVRAPGQSPTATTVCARHNV